MNGWNELASWKHVFCYLKNFEDLFMKTTNICNNLNFPLDISVFTIWRFLINVLWRKLLEEYLCRSGLRCQSDYSKVVGQSPAGGKKFAVGLTFSGQSYNRFLPETDHEFHPTLVKTWVPGIMCAWYVGDRTLSAYIPQPLGLYAPELRLSIYNIM